MERYLASTPRPTSGGVSPTTGTYSSLIDERFDHDSCGVGFVASVDGVRSHEIVEQALTALGRLAHSGATAGDGRSSDGVGGMTAIRRAVMLESADFAIAEVLVLDL